MKAIDLHLKIDMQLLCWPLGNCLGALGDVRGARRLADRRASAASGRSLRSGSVSGQRRSIGGGGRLVAWHVFGKLWRLPRELLETFWVSAGIVIGP